MSPESHLHLYEWSNQQRQLSRNGRLPEAQSLRLTQLGLDWEAEGRKLTRDERWCVMFDFLSRFVEDNGHCRVRIDPPPPLPNCFLSLLPPLQTPTHTHTHTERAGDGWTDRQRQKENGGSRTQRDRQTGTEAHRESNGYARSRVRTLSP